MERHTFRMYLPKWWFIITAMLILIYISISGIVASLPAGNKSIIIIWGIFITFFLLAGLYRNYIITPDEFIIQNGLLYHIRIRMEEITHIEFKTDTKQKNNPIHYTV